MWIFSLPLAEPSSVLSLRLCEKLLPVKSVCVMECCFRFGESKMIMVSFAVDSVEPSLLFLGHTVLFRLLVSCLILWFATVCFSSILESKAANNRRGELVNNTRDVNRSRDLPCYMRLVHEKIDLRKLKVSFPISDVQTFSCIQW